MSPIPDGGHTATTQWMSFELRMRKRRVAQCLLRADLALEDGRLEDARIALMEARELDPDSPELTGLTRRLEETREPVGQRRAMWSFAAGLLVVILAGSAVLVARLWPGAAETKPDAVALAAAVAGPAAVTGPAKSDVDVRIDRETVAAPQIRPRLADDEQLTPPRLSPPIAQAQPPRQAEPIITTARATNRAPSPPERSVPAEAGAEVKAEPPPAQKVEPPPASSPIPTVASPPVAAAKLPAASPTAEIPPPLPSAAAAPVAVDESARVRAILSQYETAYSRLDAAAASAVWPAVDRGALARAFRGLNSQRVSLGSCNVKVLGAAAQATCSGSATWEPRVGGGIRTEARRWDFELKKSGDAWRIERAIAQ